MKFSLIFAIALMLGAISTTSAQASIVSTQNIGLISSTTNTSGNATYSTSGASTETGYLTYNASLANNTKVVFSLTSNTLSPIAPSGFGLTGSVNGGADTMAYVFSNSPSVSAGSLPTLLTASLAGTSANGTISFVNTSGSSMNIKAVFNYILSLAAGGSYTVAWSSTAVPLPASVVLMLTALIGMVGYTQYRKARGEA